MRGFCYNDRIEYLEQPCRHWIIDRYVDFVNHIHDKKAYLQFLYAADNTCKLCRRPIGTYEEASLDHVYPRSKGGLSTTDNLQLAHKTCNMQKRDFVQYWRNDT